MRAFKIYLNGKRLCIAGIAQGSLDCSISCSDHGNGRGQVALNVTAILPTMEVVRWQHRSLRMNDELKIKIVEAKSADRSEVLQEAPRDIRKYEKAAVRRMAKEFGWTIQTGAAKTR